MFNYFMESGDGRAPCHLRPSMSLVDEALFQKVGNMGLKPLRQWRNLNLGCHILHEWCNHPAIRWKGSRSTIVSSILIKRPRCLTPGEGSGLRPKWKECWLWFCCKLYASHIQLLVPHSKIWISQDPMLLPRKMGLTFDGKKERKLLQAISHHSWLRSRCLPCPSQQISLTGFLPCIYYHTEGQILPSVLSRNSEWSRWG